jgi:hydrogenase maturation GTPase HydF
MKNVVHIGVFGKRNSGKSSLINSIMGQEISIVSSTPGTTTDPVRKRMELAGVGPVTFMDTAGIDDEGELGKKRVEKSIDIIRQSDIAILVITNNHLDKYEKAIINLFEKTKLSYIIVHSQSDIIPLEDDFGADLAERYGAPVIEYSSAHIDEQEQERDVEKLAEQIRSIANAKERAKGLFDGLVSKGDIVILVCPIDAGAPEGRLILPQVNAIREILDRGAISVVVQPESLADYIESNSFAIKIVVTDSQVFDYVCSVVPPNIPLTSFSILLARSRENFDNYIEGVKQIDKLKDGDRVLILESCTHHASCDDIGRVKIPALLTKYTGKKLEFEFLSGLERLPDDISSFSLAIQCGGCMVTKRQLANRVNDIISKGLPITNYGMAIAYCNKIFERATLFLK